jgi:hypothetical protein
VSRGEKIRARVRSRSGRRCEACVKCGGDRAVLFHHRKRAGRVDSDENLMHLCLACHLWVHDNPLKSYSLGWLVHSWADPAEVPMASSRISITSGGEELFVGHSVPWGSS